MLGQYSLKLWPPCLSVLLFNFDMETTHVMDLFLEPRFGSGLHFWQNKPQVPPYVYVVLNL
jgi:hypothetical protein